jgi:hypothetical protein
MMSKTIRRIEITAFRRQSLTITGASAERPIDPSTIDLDETLVAQIRALVKQLTGDTLSIATVRASQKGISKGDDNEDDAR